MSEEKFVYNGEYTDAQGDLHYKVSQKPRVRACPKCGSEKFVLNEYTNKKIADIGENGEKIIFDVTQPRYRCKECGKTWLAPIEGRRGAFTENFVRYVFEEVTGKGRSVGDVSKELEITYSTARKILTDEFDRRREKHVYRLPRRLYLDRFYLKGREVFLVVDMQELSLLDILEKKELAGRDDTGNAREIYIRGNPEGVQEIFPEAEVREYRPEIFKAGLRVLEREAEAENLDLNLLRRCLLDDEEELVGDLAVQSLKIIPIKLAYDFLKENKDNPEALREYDGELKEFGAFAGEAGEMELPEGFLPETFESFCETVENFGEKVRAHNRRRNAYDLARDMILFSGNPTFPVGLEEKDRNFGQRIRN